MDYSLKICFTKILSRKSGIMRRERSYGLRRGREPTPRDPREAKEVQLSRVRGPRAGREGVTALQTLRKRTKVKRKIQGRDIIYQDICTSILVQARGMSQDWGAWQGLPSRSVGLFIRIVCVNCTIISRRMILNPSAQLILLWQRSSLIRSRKMKGSSQSGKDMKYFCWQIISCYSELQNVQRTALMSLCWITHMSEYHYCSSTHTTLEQKFLECELNFRETH